MHHYSKNPAKIWVLMLVGVWLGGCAAGSTLQEVKAARGTGQTQEFKIPFEQIWSGLPDALERANLVVVEINKNDGYIMAQNPPSFMKSGENIVVFVQDMQQGRTLVEVISKNASSAMLSENSEKSILNSISVKMWDRYGGMPDSAIK
ncbi:MAG: hypothetical protein OEZ51_09470 [Nitrospinota bacterium]|nr:hypothetical protein [Nitrospinota bacterium]